MRIACIPLVACLLTAPVHAMEGKQQLTFTVASCSSWVDTGKPAAISGTDSVFPITSPIIVRHREIGTRHRFELTDDEALELDVVEVPDRPRQFISTAFKSKLPTLLISLTDSCELHLAKKINRAGDGTALNITSLNRDLNTSSSVEWINPPYRPPYKHGKTLSTGVRARVGMVDSGVNYLLPEIRDRLAVDSDGQLIGFDFWDMDELPFDAHPVGQGFQLQRHGTRTASLLLREAPNIELVSYRYPRPDMSRMKDLVEHAAENDVSIIGMPLGGNQREDWMAFEEAANAHPNILFIVSAGNNGRDIDAEPVYPAALSLANMLVVTSSEDFVRPAERTNWGEQSVDFLLPAERVYLSDFDGYEIMASGSSYAVSRLTALAARVSQENPEWNTSELIQALRTRYSSGGEGWVSAGYIADPLVTNEDDENRVKVTAQSSLQLPATENENQYELLLDVLVLDPHWSTERINDAALTVQRVFNQCGIDLVSSSVWSFEGPDYLQDLSTGTAQTVMNTTRKQTSKLLVVLARDTRMNEQFTGEAFGLGNTRSRPWLRYSIWLTEDVEDEGLAMAHEVYHIIANSGEHRSDTGNLMQSHTSSDNQSLTPEQCHQAIEFGLKKELLRRISQ